MSFDYLDVFLLRIEEIWMLQDLVQKSEANSLSDAESDYLVDLLNGAKGHAVIQDLVNQHVSFFKFYFSHRKLKIRCTFQIIMPFEPCKYV